MTAAATAAALLDTLLGALCAVEQILSRECLAVSV